MKYDLEELMKENMNIQETPSQELKERILYQQKEELTMRNKGKFIKFVTKAAAVVMAVALAGGGIAYAGTSLWNRYVAEDFGVAKNDTMKKDLNEKGFAQQPQVAESKNDQSFATDKDITLTVLQTLADEHSAYVCFEVKYGDQYHVVDKGATEISDTGLAYPYMVNFQMDSGIKLNYCGGVYKIKDDHTIIYNYFLTTSRINDTLRNGRINMSVSAFSMDNKKADANPTVISENGNWDLSWDLSVGTEKRIYHIDKTLTLGKYQFVLKDLEISPLSSNLTLQCPDSVSLREIGAVVRDRGDVDLPPELDENGDLKIIRYIYTGDEEGWDQVMKELPKGETLWPLDSVTFYLGGKKFDGRGGMGVETDNYIYNQFNKVMDLEKLTGIRVAGKYIDLKSVPYETVQ